MKLQPFKPRANANHVYKVMDSPLGKLKLIACSRGLSTILWEKDDPRRVRLRAEVENTTHPVLLETERQLQEYFEGKRKSFDLTLDFTGTEFQHKVWRALLTIPFGQTRSYGQIARQIGHANAVRAVGAANARNPISIIAPCHRVIGASGKLTGFAGGLEIKAHLLKLEKPYTANNAAQASRKKYLTTGFYDFFTLCAFFLTPPLRRSRNNPGHKI